jgi:hypothetical protein
MSLSLSRNQRDEIHKYVKDRLEWGPDEYKMGLMDEWDNSRVPLVVGIPTKRKVDHSPMFVILPDGSLVGRTYPDAFERILAAYFTSLNDSDATALAQLALWFGRFENVVGALWTRDITGKIPKSQIKRSQTEPALRITKKGFVISFYAYDYELLRLSDCTVTMESGGARFSSVKFSRQ